MALDYKHTCPDIDNKIGDFKINLDWYLTYLLHELKIEVNQHLITTYVDNIYRDSEKIFEDVRKVNSGMRDEADKQIDEAEEKLREAEEEIKRLESRIDELEEELKTCQEI